MLAGDHVIAQDTLTREHVSYFRVTWHTSQPSPKKKKKNLPNKNPYISGNRTF